VLNIAEGTIGADDGWTMVQSRRKNTRVVGQTSQNKRGLFRTNGVDNGDGANGDSNLIRSIMKLTRSHIGYDEKVKEAYN
jgi:hypothetical protein